MSIVSDFKSGPYHFMSNFYVSPVRYGGIEYPTAEHAYQAAKCAHREDKLAILALKSPSQAKRFGKWVGTNIEMEEQFYKYRLTIMEDILRAKFSQAELADKLVATAPAVIVYDNPWHETFWGVYQGSGENHLGRILMTVRGVIAAARNPTHEKAYHEHVTD